MKTLQDKVTSQNERNDMKTGTNEKQDLFSFTLGEADESRGIVPSYAIPFKKVRSHRNAICLLSGMLLVILILALSVYVIHPFKVYDEHQLQQCYEYAECAVVFVSSLMEQCDNLIGMSVTDFSTFQIDSDLMNIYIDFQSFDLKASEWLADIDLMNDEVQSHRNGIKPPVNLLFMRKLVADCIKSVDTVHHICSNLKEIGLNSKEKLIQAERYYQQYLEALGRYMYLNNCELYAPIGNVPEACMEMFLRTYFARYIPLSAAAKQLAPASYVGFQNPSYSTIEAVEDIEQAQNDYRDTLRQTIQDMIVESIVQEDQVDADGVFLQFCD